MCARAPLRYSPSEIRYCVLRSLSLSLSTITLSLSRGIRADRVFPFSLTLPVYFFLLSSPWPYVTVDRPPHRNRQHCYTLPRLPVPRSVLEPSTVIQSALRTFRSSRVTSPLSPLSLSLSPLSFYLSFSSSRYDACGIDPLVLSISLFFSRGTQHPLAVREIDSVRSFLILRCTRLLDLPSPWPPAPSVIRLSRLVPFLPLSALPTFFHLPRYLLTVAIASLVRGRARDLTYLSHSFPIPFSLPPPPPTPDFVPFLARILVLRDSNLKTR